MSDGLPLIQVSGQVRPKINLSSFLKDSATMRLTLHSNTTRCGLYNGCPTSAQRPRANSANRLMGTSGSGKYVNSAKIGDCVVVPCAAIAIGRSSQRYDTVTATAVNPKPAAHFCSGTIQVISLNSAAIVQTRWTNATTSGTAADSAQVPRNVSHL